MIDGLALGETTPGPLIMVVAFVGYLGGNAAAPLGPDMAVMGGIVAAVTVTWFTFLPSFLFILAGGPLVETTHNELRLTAPLVAITAAVVGVIVNLAVFFGYHVFWPEGLSGNFEWPAAWIAIVAGFALWKYRRGVVEVICFCAATGLILRMVGA